MRKDEHEQLGFSQRDFLNLFILDSLLKNENYPMALYNELKESYPNKAHSYAYLCKVTKQMEEEGLISNTIVNRKNLFNITQKGKERHNWFSENYQHRLNEINLVIDRFIYDLTKSGEPKPVDHILPDDYRRFFSKLVSVKDLVRYVTLKRAHHPVYMGEIREILATKFGWEASNGYLYDIAHEMENMNLVIGEWPDEKRTKRYLIITEEGKYHYNQIANDARDRLVNISKFLHEILSLLK